MKRDAALLLGIAVCFLALLAIAALALGGPACTVTHRHRLEGGVYCQPDGIGARCVFDAPDAGTR